MSKVTLNKLEVYIAQQVAKSRVKNAEANGNGRTSADMSRSVYAVFLEGVYGELAFCKLLNIYPEEVFSMTLPSVKAGTDYGDIHINGLNIDIKTTRYQTGMLCATTHNPNIDVYLLMVGDDVTHTYECRGAMTRDELVQDKNFGNNNGKFKVPCHYASQDMLHDYKKLLDIK